MLVETNPDICTNCGRDWPAKFGAHRCKMVAVRIHENAVVVEPRDQMRDAIQRIAHRFERELCRSAEYADIGGDESPYPAALRDIDATIGFLKRFRADIQKLRTHRHKYDSNDYCTICGADGRA